MDELRKYRIIIIPAFAVSFAALLFLFISTWNLFSMAAAIRVHGLYYVSIILVMIFLSAIFVCFMNITGTPGQDTGNEDALKEDVREPDHPGPEKATEKKVPFEVDIDLLAEKIIPRAGPREMIKGLDEKILVNLARHFNAASGIIFIRDLKTGHYSTNGTYAFVHHKDPLKFREGEGLPGQAARNKKIIQLNHVPGDYMQVASGLGRGIPQHLLIMPVIYDKTTIAVIEMASFSTFNEEQLWVLDKLASIIGKSLYTNIKRSQSL